MEIKIRPAIIDDFKPISDILRSFGWFDHITRESPEETEARVKKHIELCNRNDSHNIRVAENHERQVVGYVAVHWLPYLILSGVEGYISELFISETARGQKVGTQLLDWVKSEAIKRDCSRLQLLNIKTRPSYEREFYKKHGWTERPQVADFIFPLK